MALNTQITPDNRVGNTDKASQDYDKYGNIRG